ncbi:MAG TPA: chemotaxis protein CheA [Terriglobales bacterium]|nr:chemotaxis protein CheA [Terriglobales bacterium]
MTDELTQDDGLIQEFVNESEEQLQTIEQDLLQLENSSDPEMLNRVFRAMHTIKGTSSFLQFDAIVEVTHQAEDVLNALRRDECHANKGITDVMLRVCDRLHKMLADVANHRELQYDNESLLSDLRDAREGSVRLKLGGILTSQPVIVEQELEAALAEAQRTGRKLGQVLVEREIATPGHVEQALSKQGIVASVTDNTTLRVDVRKLDHLVNLVGELVLERNRLVQLSRDAETHMSKDEMAAGLTSSATRLSFITDELQTASLQTRMVPIEYVFRRLPRMVRDVAGGMGKQVELAIRGQETEIDKTMVEQISDPLVHLVRNAIDHGIETPEKRRAAGKPERGVLTIEARAEGDQIVVSVMDDGKGIDAEAVVKKAVEKGFVTADQAKSLSRCEALELIFLPGMSTAEKVNSVSGRGVGMDVVRSNVKRLNGTVDLESVPEKGTTITIRAPLTMAILPVLLVEVGGEVYALPLRSVEETVRVEPGKLHLVEGMEVLCHGDCTLPVLRLGDLFGVQGVGKGESRAVVLSLAEKKIALLVDGLVGQESTVIKSMGRLLHEGSGFAGATVGGDGRVRLVLDPASLVGRSQYSRSGREQ